MNSEIFTVDNVNSAFLECANYILKQGRKVSPRGMMTFEIPTSIVEITNPQNCVITLKERKHPYSFMCMELIWILSGDKEPWIIQYLPRLNDYTNVIDGRKILAGAYGPRLLSTFDVNQFEYIIHTLRIQEDTRQAIMTISNPTIDSKGYKDFPCTQSFQFLIRDGKLDLTVVMRSNDLYLGSCTDWFNFCTIQCIIASILKIPVGVYRHVTGSLHIYERDIPKIETILSNSTEVISIDIPKHSTMDYDFFGQVLQDSSFGRNLKSGLVLPAAWQLTHELEIIG